jgi:glucose-6-phosphate isomerase
MALKAINPTQTKAWEKLKNHAKDIENLDLRSLFKEDENRSSNLTFSQEGMEIDLSKNNLTNETLELLLDLSKELDLADAKSKYFGGDTINTTENRAVLHTALRNFSGEAVYVDGKDVMSDVHAALDQMKIFSDKVISGQWKGYTGKSITDIVNIGIGGSDLGPNMVVDALRFYKNHLNVHFVSNIDGDHVMETIKPLNPETTLFVVVSKTFTTQETLTNATTIKNWFLQKASQEDVAKHFVAVSTNLNAISSFGIDTDNVFPMWDWVGGRFSLWSAVGLSISLAVGYDNFDQLLKGAHQMDMHFKNADDSQNIPLVLALLSVWYNNFQNCETEAILPYSQYLGKLSDYLQQAIMESNGKSVDRSGEDIDYQTGTIIWGSTGTNMQHAFMQLVHQGTKVIPSEFIGFKESLYGNTEHHAKLMANYYAQMEALAFGKSKEEVHLDLKTQGQADKISTLLPYKVFKGNRPSTSILLDKLTPYSLGQLIALYEHKIFVQGIIWNIFSYDQFGVELGKELAKKLYKE